MSTPCRVSRRGTRAIAAYSPKRGEVDGNHGQGATTRAVTSPLSTSLRSRVSTKIPCCGRGALGYNVVKVKICTGEMILERGVIGLCYAPPPDAKPLRSGSAALPAHPALSRDGGLPSCAAKHLRPRRERSHY